MLADTPDLARDFVWWKYEIHAAGSDGALRHSFMVSRGVLRKGDSPFGLNLFQSHGAVCGSAGKDHSDGLVTLLSGERAKEPIDGMVDAATFAGQELQFSPNNDHA